MNIRPYQISIAEEAIQDLRRRLEMTRWPKSIDVGSWEDGAALSFMERLAEYWLHQFDWREQEARLNHLPNWMMSVDGYNIHFVHQTGVGPSPLPIILTHGWPGSFIEMEHLVPLLSDPGAHGADPADAFHVVVPSLPGYGFSTGPANSGTSSKQIAILWHGLMAELGYDRYAAQGGDIGAGVSMWLARLFPSAIAGIHLNYIPGSFRPPLGLRASDITVAEQSFLDSISTWTSVEGAYAALQSTKPQTLAFSLTDSPVGLAAWIAEKFRTWSDCGGKIESVITMDALLTDISLYWFSDSLAASLRLYKENRNRPLTFGEGERVVPPLGMALFPRELPAPPRSWVERVFDVRRWTSMPAGGHFAAIEQPQLLAAEIREYFRPLRCNTN